MAPKKFLSRSQLRRGSIKKSIAKYFFDGVGEGEGAKKNSSEPKLGAVFLDSSVKPKDAASGLGGGLTSVRCL